MGARTAHHETANGVAGMISLRDHGLMDAPSERAQLTVHGIPDMPEAISAAVVSGGIAGVEAVAGRVSRLMSMATVGGSPMAARLLTPTVLGMLGRYLIEWGETLFYFDVSGPGPPELVPAQYAWTVYGGVKRSSWVIDATLSGAMTIREQRAPRGGWLHVIREAHPDYPTRGVPGIQRAQVTYEMAKTLEDALLREGRQPTKSVIPAPQGLPEATKTQLRAFLEDRVRQVVFPETTQAGFGGGRTSAPQTDWKPHRLMPDPSSGLYIAARDAQARVVSALGAHPAIIGGAASTGTVDREARRQLLEFLVMPAGRLIEYEASMLFGAPVTLTWERNPDTMMVVARTAKIEAETANLLKPPEPAPAPPVPSEG